jgi:uncharacterized iron-regulated protein
MTKIFLICLMTLSLGLLPQAVSGHILDLASGEYIPLTAMLDDLQTSRVVFVGELHDNVSHHAAQLRIIRELVERGAKVAVALEMFRADGQPTLDQWSQGLLEEGPFKEIYDDHWSMWPIYRPIFAFAKERNIPLIGLNIDRELTRQVSSSGFASLDEEQLAQLDGVSCDIDQRYQAYLRKALGSHQATSDKFEFFCEAQMVWDNMMARHLVDWLEQHPDTLVVVLAGSGHAWRYGLPEQLSRRMPVSYRILLPEIPRRSDRSNTTRSEADYLLLGLGLGELH